MNPTEKDRLEKEIRENGIDSNHMAISVKQLALLNWHNIDELKDDVRELKSTVPTRSEIFTAIGAMGVVFSIITGLFFFLS